MREYHMPDLEKLDYARFRLGLALIARDPAEIENWKEHVKFWQEQLNTTTPTT